MSEQLAASDRLLPPLDSIPLLDKVESFAKSDADDKLETVEADDSDDSDAESDGGASTAPDDDDDEEEVERETNLTLASSGTEEAKPAVELVSVGSGATAGMAEKKEGRTGLAEARESEMATEKPAAGSIAAERIAL